MKTKFLAIPAVVGLLMITSCSHKPSAETVKEIGDFETAWTDLGTKATAWSVELKASVDKCAAHCAMTDSMATANAAMMNDAMKAKCEPMMTACKNDKSSFEAMWGEWTNFEAAWGESTTAFGAWKDKVMKGEVKGEEVAKGLTDFKAKMEENKAKVDSWTAAYAGAKETCAKNMEACAAGCKMMMEEMEKGKGKKKK